MAIESINPATEEKIKSYPQMSQDEVSRIVEQTNKVFQTWRSVPFSDRTPKMKRAAEILRKNLDEYAHLMAEEMGKPVSQGRSEAEKCAGACDYYAENAEKFLAPEIVPTDASKSFVTFQPLGIVLAVMPWNFPFWQVFRFAAPALMAGNAGLLKHASNVPGCALAIEQIFQQSGFPEHLFRDRKSVV